MSPSMLHEAILALFRNRPSLAPEVLGEALGVDIPSHDEVRIDSTKLTEVTPVEYDADLVVLLVDERPVLGIVVEVQLGRKADKRRVWPYYVAALRARLRCPVKLLVVCSKATVARWASSPIDLDGSGSTLRPQVLGPSSVPVVTDRAEAARAPELAVLSAMSHGRGKHGFDVGLAAALASATLDDERALFYTDLVLTALGDAARKALGELMTEGSYEYQSELARKYFGQGKAEGRAEGKAEALEEGAARGKAEAILAVLATRGIEVDDEAKATIRVCTDHAQLDTWLARAVTAKTLAELLG